MQFTNPLTRPDFVVFSNHACERKAQRGIRDAEIALAVRYGKRYWKQGRQLCFLGRRRIPAHIPHDLARRAEGTVVILGGNETICTVFRDRNYLRQLRRRLAHS